MDYYSILGVPRNASEKELKQAYKKMSMQHHPDRGGDEAKFKEVNEAYSTLKDPQKRKQYDNPQSQYRFNTTNNYDFSGFSPNDFADLFTQRTGRRTRKNRDIRISAELTLPDVLFGKDLVARYRLHSGKTQDVNIHIPKGVDHGQNIKFHGLGDDTHPQIQRGDLIVSIRVKRDPNWKRDGIDLHKSIDISVFDAIMGCKQQITTLDNRRLELKIPKGTQPGATFSINGHGLPILNHHNRGNIFVHVNVRIPTGLTEEQLEKIQDVKDEITLRTK